MSEIQKHIWRRYRVRLLRIIEGLVKEVCFFYFGFASWVFDIRQRKNPQSDTAVMGLICQEFFRSDLGGFGGYGMTVKNITDYYNSRSNGFTAKVIMPQDQCVVNKHEIRKIHNAETLLLPSLLKLALHPIQYVKKLNSLQINFFLTIDYLVRYEYVLWATPKIPIILYIRDPRSREVWETISTVPQELAANLRSSKKDLIGIAEQHAASFRRIQRWSKWLGRKIIFATNADFLTLRAKSEFHLDQLKPYYLPNPLPMPEVEDISFDSKPMLLALGRLDPQKRPWIIFELARRLPEITFVIGGQSRFPELLGSNMEQYRQLPNLKFVGVVEGTEKDALLRRCWGLINTSIHEGLPVSFLETFSYGKCVISCLNPAGLVEKYGYYIGEHQGQGLDETTLQAFERKIRECFSDENERCRKGRLARSYVQQYHTFSNFHQHLVAMIDAEKIFSQVKGS